MAIGDTIRKKLKKVKATVDKNVDAAKTTARNAVFEGTTAVKRGVDFIDKTRYDLKNPYTTITTAGNPRRTERSRRINGKETPVSGPNDRPGLQLRVPKRMSTKVTPPASKTGRQSTKPPPSPAGPGRRPPPPAAHPGKRTFVDRRAAAKKAALTRKARGK